MASSGADVPSAEEESRERSTAYVADSSSIWPLDGAMELKETLDDRRENTHANSTNDANDEPMDESADERDRDATSSRSSHESPVDKNAIEPLLPLPTSVSDRVPEVLEEDDGSSETAARDRYQPALETVQIPKTLTAAVQMHLRAENDDTLQQKDGEGLQETPSFIGLYHAKITGIVYDVRLLGHVRPTQVTVSGDSYTVYPEVPERITGIYSELKRQGLRDRCEVIKAIPAAAPSGAGNGDAADPLRLVHSERLVRTLIKSATASEYELKKLAGEDEDIFFTPDTAICARIACGGVISACLAVMDRVVTNAFAIVRPPGHHAEPDKAMGFCHVNNVAIAARRLVELKKAKRILIVDWDIHHGNGTQKEFYNDPNVLYFSVHRFDDGNFYPHSREADLDYIGGPNARGRNVNVPWSARGMGDADYIHVWNRILIPLASEFNPDITLVSAGFDAALGDPLGECDVTPLGFAHLTRGLMGVAGGRLVLALEGGYNIDVISQSAAACVSALLGDPLEPVNPAIKPRAVCVEVVDRVREKLGPYWDCMGAKGSASSGISKKGNTVVTGEMRDALLNSYSFPLSNAIRWYNRSIMIGMLHLKPLVLARPGSAKVKITVGGPGPGSVGPYKQSNNSGNGETESGTATGTTGTAVVAAEQDAKENGNNAENASDDAKGESMNVDEKYDQAAEAVDPVEVFASSTLTTNNYPLFVMVTEGTYHVHGESKGIESSIADGASSYYHEILSRGHPLVAVDLSMRSVETLSHPSMTIEAAVLDAGRRMWAAVSKLTAASLIVLIGAGRGAEVVADIIKTYADSDSRIIAAVQFTHGLTSRRLPGRAGSITYSFISGVGTSTPSTSSTSHELIDLHSLSLAELMIRNRNLALDYVKRKIIASAKE